jgi:hypothetical protein
MMEFKKFANREKLGIMALKIKERTGPGIGPTNRTRNKIRAFDIFWRISTAFSAERQRILR